MSAIMKRKNEENRTEDKVECQGGIPCFISINNFAGVLSFWLCACQVLECLPFYLMKKIDINFSSGGCLRGHSLDSHADGLSLFGNPPQGEEQTDVLSVVQEQRASGGLGFQEGFQSLDGLFHLTHKLINILFFKSIT